MKNFLDFYGSILHVHVLVIDFSKDLVVGAQRVLATALRQHSLKPRSLKHSAKLDLIATIRVGSPIS